MVTDTPSHRLRCPSRSATKVSYHSSSGGYPAHACTSPDSARGRVSYGARRTRIPSLPTLRPIIGVLHTPSLHDSCDRGGHSRPGHAETTAPGWRRRFGPGLAGRTGGRHTGSPVTSPVRGGGQPVAMMARIAGARGAEYESRAGSRGTSARRMALDFSGAEHRLGA